MQAANCIYQGAGTKAPETDQPIFHNHRHKQSKPTHHLLYKMEYTTVLAKGGARAVGNDSSFASQRYAKQAF